MDDSCTRVGVAGRCHDWGIWVEKGAVAVDGDLWLVVFRAGEQDCALPIEAVDRVVPMVEMAPLDRVAPLVVGLIDFHGTPVPVFDLMHRLRMGTAEYGASAFLLIGRTERRPYAVAAHAVEGAIRISEARLASMKNLLPGAGLLPSVIAGARGLVFVHDPETLLTLDQEQALDMALQARA